MMPQIKSNKVTEFLPYRAKKLDALVKEAGKWVNNQPCWEKT